MPKALLALLRLSASVGALSLVGIGLMVTADVLIRWVTGKPVSGVFELASLMLVIAIFLPLGFMQHEKLHIRVDMISSRARGRWAAALDVLDAAAGILVFGLLLWAAVSEFLMAYRGGFRLRGIIEIPTALQIGFIVFGTALILVALGYLLVKSLRALRRPGTPP